MLCRVIRALKLPSFFSRALCRPTVRMLKPEHYEQWKEIEITFVPRSMIRG